jgi:hypothetical protein
MPTAATASDNGRTAQFCRNPIGAECEACKRRALLPLDRLGTLEGNMRPLKSWPLKCSAWDRARWLFAKRAKADEWADGR